MGQNLAIIWSTAPLDPNDGDFPSRIQNWFNEVQKYSYGDAWSPKTGHYSQLVWGETNLIGCGFAEYKDASKYNKLYVCNYGPGGNVVGYNPYQVGRPSCSVYGLKQSTRYQGLCVEDNLPAYDDNVIETRRPSPSHRPFTNPQHYLHYHHNSNHHHHRQSQHHTTTIVQNKKSKGQVHRKKVTASTHSVPRPKLMYKPVITTTTTITTPTSLLAPSAAAAAAAAAAVEQKRPIHQQATKSPVKSGWSLHNWTELSFKIKLRFCVHITAVEDKYMPAIRFIAISLTRKQ
uniref:SCP domain-containing protein n=1 Tax=Glossina brevipalpis TaxID=37001 RepID=A0A1A9WYF7_9MUSC